MNNIDNNLFFIEEEIKKIEKIAKEDPLKAIYVLDEDKKQFSLKEDLDDLDALRDNIEFQLKKQNLITSTKLDTLSLINSLKNKKMGYAFMLSYNELKKRDDIAKYAIEFQDFFKGNDFDSKGFQTLIYDLLVNSNIDFEYDIQNKKINPKKLGSLLKNAEIQKMQDEIIATFDKDISKNKVARQVFSAYLFQNWVAILLHETKDDYLKISHVIEVILGNQTPDSLSKEEKELYNIFK
ncbi:hypothetical protein [Metamycoplasma hominis]|uniref:hypothetical protein n=1 Tax=Metamycoplasma hominis TaxID=2098 RepID=UPI00093FB870|nr:hypothetical protein [Metamycoplasma hominis]OKL23969.1 hypothetical protein BRO51_00510 [Metamycoplasma hominis]RBI34266.1 hypothetical protein DRZ74_00520 [Metamycoplasma hominis]